MLNKAGNVGAVLRRQATYGGYKGDGTASLSDSLRALHADMVARGYPPSTTKVR